MSKTLENFYKDSKQWQDWLLQSSTSKIEQKVINDVFVRLRDHLPKEIRKQMSEERN